MTSTPDPYVHGHHESVLRSHSARTVENSAPQLLPHLRAGLRILDVGCGPGTITVDLAEQVAPGAVIGIDAEPEVLARASALCDAGGLRNVRFARGDVYALDFDDDAFDVVHAHQVLQHLRDPVRALAEMRRVARAGGIVTARDADYAAMTWAPHDAGLDRWLALYHELARGTGGEPDAGRYLPGWARAAGFDEVATTSSTWTYAMPEERAWWAGLWADRVRSSSFADRALASGAATAADLDAMAAAWLRWADHDDAVFVVVHVEIVCTA